jgi:predicted regulator of Ras-like GTPase activity (Roadblock/LC7/MglB family)
VQPHESRFSSEVAARAAQELDALGQANRSIELAVLTSEDGFEIAAYRGQVISGRIAAMSSSLQALSEAITREAGLHNTRNLIIEAETGTILIIGLQSPTIRASLSVVASTGETLGQLLWAARNCSKTLEQVLQGTKFYP